MTRFIAACLAALALAGCGERPPNTYSGYAEGEYVRIAAPFAGALSRLDVKRGDTVEANRPLFALEHESERAEREEAQAQVARAEAQLADLQKGKREPEIAAVRAQMSQAQAAHTQSSSQLKRDQALVAQGFVAEQKLVDSRAAEERDRARVAELASQLKVAELKARPDEIAAAARQVDAARQTLAQAQWKLEQKSQRSPAAGVVTDTYFVQGEWVPAGAPVVSLLPPQNIKARFYVPEKEFGSIRIGAAVTLHCDGCAAPIAAQVSYLSPQAEYTPPVIYSKESREKLVFLAEARAAPAEATRMHPGQPLEVTLAAPAAANGAQ
jgi:HlyD family secretion protein